MRELPPDRSGLPTEERHRRSMDLHERSVASCVSLLLDTDRKEVSRAMSRGRRALVAFIEDLVPRFTAGGRLIYLGAGTSGRLGVLDAAEVPPTFQVMDDRVIGLIAGGERALRQAVEGAEDNPGGALPELSRLRPGTLDTILGLTAGGTTPYVLGALQHLARRVPRPLLGLLACAPGPCPPGVNHHIVLPTGPEVLTGSTRLKAATATKLALNTITTTLMVQSGRVHENLMVALRASNAKLRDRAARIVVTLTGVERSAAFALLDEARGDVPTAVLMARGQLEVGAARAILEQHDGRLSAALAALEPGSSGGG